MFGKRDVESNTTFFSGIWITINCSGVNNKHPSAERWGFGIWLSNTLGQFFVANLANFQALKCVSVKKGTNIRYGQKPSFFSLNQTQKLKQRRYGSKCGQSSTSWRTSYILNAGLSAPQIQQTNKQTNKQVNKQTNKHMNKQTTKKHCQMHNGPRVLISQLE